MYRELFPSRRKHKKNVFDYRKTNKHKNLEKGTISLFFHDSGIRRLIFFCVGRENNVVDISRHDLLQGREGPPFKCTTLRVP